MLNIKNEKTIFMQHGLLDCLLEIDSGKVYAIWGANGIGKSTFFSYLKTRSKDISWGMSFLEQAELRPLGAVSLHHIIKVLRKKHEEELEDIDYLIDFFNFGSLLQRPINFLSGGQKQLAKIILCLAKKAQLYCLDEPFNNLDEEKESRLYQYLQEARQHQQKSFLVIDHNRYFLESVVDQVFYFRKKDGSDSYFLGA